MNSAPPEQSNLKSVEAAREMEENLERLVRLKNLSITGRVATAALYLIMFFCQFMIRDPWLKFCLASFSAVTASVSLGLTVYFQKKCNKSVQALQSLKDVNYIGALLDIASFDSTSYSQELRMPLINLLMQVRASHTHFLKQRHRSKLYLALRPEYMCRSWVYNKKFTLAILKALEQVGDKDAVSHVERVVQNGNDAEVRRAAEECLVFLRQRVEQQSVYETLLRPSDVASAAPETLLRAAAARPDEQPELLLHAHAAPDECND